MGAVLSIMWPLSSKKSKGNNGARLPGMKEDGPRQTRTQQHWRMKAPHCAVLYKENERRGRLSRCPEPVAQVSYHANRFCPPEHFHLQLCVWRPRREPQTKGHGGLSVGPTWAGASPVISNTLPGFPQTHSVPKRGSAPRQPCQCLEMWCHVDKIQERKHIKTDSVVSLLSVSGSLQWCQTSRFISIKLQRL